MKYLIYTFIILSTSLTSAQVNLGYTLNVNQNTIKIKTSILRGIVTEINSGEPAPFCDVAIYQDNILITGSQTDFDGNYILTNIPLGFYEIRASYVGFKTERIEDFYLYDQEVNELNIDLTAGLSLDEIVICCCYCTSREGTGNRHVANNRDKYLPQQNTSNSALTEYIPDEDQLKDIPQIYPNPSTGVISISSKNSINSTPWKIIDGSGKQVSESKRATMDNQFDFSHLSQGTYYFIYQSTSGDIQSIPIVKIE